MSKYSISNVILIDTSSIREVDELDSIDDNMVSSETIMKFNKFFEIGSDDMKYKSNCSLDQANIIRNKIFENMLPFKRDIQSFITDSLYQYGFVENNKLYSMDEFVEEMNTNIYNTIYKNKSFSDEWQNNKRFYLKGGKSLNKLIKKLEKENIFESITKDLKYLNKINGKQNLFDSELSKQSNTDYDFTLLFNPIKSEFLNKINEDNLHDYLKKYEIDLVEIMNEEASKLNVNETFIKFKNGFTSSLNQKINDLIPKLKNTIEEIKKFINSKETDKLDYKEYIKEYLQLKIIQIENFILKIENNKIKFSDPVVEVSYGFYPIIIYGSIDQDTKKQNISKFLLYRMKLSYKINGQELYKINQDIKNFVIKKCTNQSYNDLENKFPFSNIFGELIDIGVSIGDENRQQKLWNSSDINYLLRPLIGLDNNYAKNEYQIVYNYPCADLKYQFKDIVSIFNFDKPQKLEKRCKRVIEYLKMICLTNDYPDLVKIFISPELKYELDNNKNGSCDEMTELLKLLQDPSVRIINNYYIFDTKIIKNYFPNLCQNKFKISMSLNIDNYNNFIDNISWLNYNHKQIAKKISSKDFFQNFLNLNQVDYNFNINNYSNSSDVIRKLEIIGNLFRLIPIKFY